MATAAAAPLPLAAAAKDEQTAHRFAKDQLKAFVERVERLEEEKKAIADDIRDVYAEAKGNGFDVKALRAVVRLRKQDVDERKEQEAILETYLHALGIWGRGLLLRSSRTGGDPVSSDRRLRRWTPAFAGMSGRRRSPAMLEYRLVIPGRGTAAGPKSITRALTVSTRRSILKFQRIWISGLGPLGRSGMTATAIARCAACS